jgi:hypothetical protein
MGQLLLKVLVMFRARARVSVRPVFWFRVRVLGRYRAMARVKIWFRINPRAMARTMTGFWLGLG